MSRAKLSPADVDVVFRLDQLEGQPTEVDGIWKNQQRIGNNRFGFIIAHHMASFVEATKAGKGDVVEQIIDGIVHIIRDKNQMNARFMGVKRTGNGEDSYVDMEGGPEVKRIIWRILRSAAETTTTFDDVADDSSFSWSRKLPSKVGEETKSSGNVAMGDSSPVGDSWGDLSDADRRRKRRALLSARPQKRLSGTSVASGASKKEARLRFGRSSSEPSQVMTAQNEGWPQAPAYLRNEDLDKYDVVIIGNPPQPVKEDRQYVGNNRFRVMANMRRERYFAASETERYEIAKGMFEMMDKYTPKGRIVAWDEQTGLWKEQDSGVSIQITKLTLDEACAGMATDKLKAPVEDIAKTDIDSLRLAAVANLQERMEKKQMMRNLEGRSGINRNPRDKKK